MAKNEDLRVPSTAAQVSVVDDQFGTRWWDKGNCDSNRANVYNCLYEWYTDNSWRQMACSPTKELAPRRREQRPHGGTQRLQ
jgi:hypothetical protein